ncbi:MAG: hypothetical protein JXA94_01765 [Parachlamydiales bacterium]|nr:hypothetical protein [Parachlamydiales bacterium]
MSALRIQGFGFEQSTSLLTAEQQVKSPGPPHDEAEFDGQGASCELPINQIKDVFFDGCKHLLPPRLVGGKAYNLQKLSRIEGITIPKWFVLSSNLFRQFLNENDILEDIERLDILCENSEANEQAINLQSERIRNKISKGVFSADLFVKIKTSYELISDEAARFAIRSSGAIEDSQTSSCAGLYDSVLNISGIDNILTAVKSVWSSSFNERVVRERIRLKVNQKDCLMGVIVQKLIDSKVSGVASTLVLGNNYPGIQIAANYGLGESVVSGEVSVDSFVVHPENNYIIEAIRGSKEFCYVKNSTNGVEKIALDEERRKKYVMDFVKVHELSDQVRAIKKEYGCDVDVEFAIDENQIIHILQARPLVKSVVSKIKVVNPEDAITHEIIARGNYSVPGVTTGRLVYIPSWEKLSSGEIVLNENDIALAHVTTNVWSHYFSNIKGVVTKEGSPSSHPMLLSREKGIPCVIGINEDFDNLIRHNGQTVTIDGINKVIYAGEVTSKEADSLDLLRQFETVRAKPWPEISEILPHLIHNKMVLQQEGKYWRKTPTYPLFGFQLELNMMRFDKVPKILQKSLKKPIEARVINNFVCNELSPFNEYVALFDDFSAEQASRFNEDQQRCMDKFLEVSKGFSLDPHKWKEYIDTYAEFRAYIWLGGAYRAYSERKTEEISSVIQLPQFYLDEAAQEMQSNIIELDTKMHEEVYKLAKRCITKEKFENIEVLRQKDVELYDEVVKLSKKYRFEHTIALDTPIDLDLIYNRIYQEVERIKTKDFFNSFKNAHTARDLLCENTDLKKWLQNSIQNRILQSDAHHIDASAKAYVRPQLLELAKVLVERKLIKSEGDIFSATSDEIYEYIKTYNMIKT